jgi:hypothetical protein
MKFGLRLDLGIGPANGSPEDDGIALSQFLKVEFGIDRSIFDQARITGEFDHACQALGQQLAVKLCQDLPRMGPAMAKFLAERLKKAFENGSRIVLPGGLT